MKILVLDIETAPFKSLHWKLWKEFISIDQIEEEWSILSYCAKWLGSKTITYDDTSQQRNVRDDRRLLRKLWKLLDEADIVVAQNGKKFDIKKINARLIMEGYGPYSPVKVVDTYLAARRIAGFSSNKQAWLSKYLSNAKKLDHRNFPGIELWKECLKKNPAAWREMRKYNIQDVIGCEGIYLRLRPWIENHPNVAPKAVAKDPDRLAACPNCGSTKLHSRGDAVTAAGIIYDRYQCQGCGAWPRSRKRKKAAA